MKQKLTSEKLDELASLYLIEYGMFLDSELEPKKCLQQLAKACFDGRVPTSPLEAALFVGSRPSIVRYKIKKDPTKAEVFTVRSKAELAQFLSALVEEIATEWQSRLSKFIPDEVPKTVELNEIGC